MKRKTKLKIYTFLFLVAIIAVTGGYFFYAKNIPPKETEKITYKTPEEADPYVRFDMEIYDSIQKNYWQKASDADLSTLYSQAITKATGSTTILLTLGNRFGVAKMLAQAMTMATSTTMKKDLALGIGQIVLYNISPQGRSGLLSSAQETQMRNTVANIQPDNDPYETLGVAKTASPEEILIAFNAKKAELKNATTTEAKALLEKITKANTVLTDKTNKTLYDTTKMQPSIFMHIDGKETLYIDMSQVTPASFGEFVQKFIDVVDKNPQLTNLILDLRHNIGGTLDFAAYFMALFHGPNQYVYDLVHQGDFTVVRTPAQIPKLTQLEQFKEVAILTDNMTQSTAELTTAIFKKFKMAQVVGGTTRGWGTVENTFPIQTSIEASTTYTVLMVHSLTLRDDGEPIEGRGVEPNLNISDKNWKAKLSNYFKSADLIKAVIKEMAVVK